MSEDSELDVFFEDLSELSKQDIILAYSNALKDEIKKTNIYFFDRESKTLLALIRGENCFLCVRVEGKGHHCTKGLIRKIRLKLSEIIVRDGRPIYAKTAKKFYQKRAKKLLNILGFEFLEEKGGYFISEFTGDNL